MSTVTMSRPTADHSEEIEGLFREHYLLVYRTAWVITGNPDDAEDVLQTIFLRLMRRTAPPDIRKNGKGISTGLRFASRWTRFVHDGGKS